MSLATALLTPILGDASPWTPRRLFQLGEAGGVYDPSDLTAEKVAWRRNLLTWSEDFTNAAWTKTRSSITPNAGTSWDGTATASKLVEDTTASSTHYVQQQATSSVASQTISIYAKSAERSLIGVYEAAIGAGTVFDLANGTVSSSRPSGWSVPAASTIEAIGSSGWYRLTVTISFQAVATRSFRFFTLIAANSDSYTGDGTSGVLIDSAQFEFGTATAYQRITDFTSDFLAAFPTHGLYQDAAGTTPVTALGQPVGLVIDSKTGGLANLGPELVSGGVVGLLGTATAATYNTTTGVGACTRVDISNQSYVEWSGLNNARLYRLRVQVTGSVAMWVRSGDVSAINPFTAAANATTQLIIAPSGGKITLTTQTGTSNFTVLAFNEVPGVHAIQPTSASRPLLDARVNLLTFSEQFDNAAWTKLGSSVTANATTAPDGTTTADRLVEDSSTGTHQVRQDFTTAAVPYVFSVYAKADTRSWLLLYNTTAGYGRAFNLATGQIGTASIGTSTATIEVAGNGWYRCTLTGTATAASNAFRIYLNTADDMNASYVGNGTSGAFLWGADLRLAADAAYPYQRVAAATDYADVGVPRSFLFDGFDDSLYTASNMDLSGTDKVTVLAGVRKLSDAATGIAVELTSSSNVNTGSFALLAPSAGGANSYRFLSHGTGISTAGSGVFAAAPDISVLTGIADIAGDVCSLRRNGAAIVTSATDQGTGNYSSAVLFIGRRNNTSDPLTGKAYQLIVRGALTDAATLAQAERYVGAKTGLYL